jgi:hypothetical protein
MAPKRFNPLLTIGYCAFLTMHVGCASWLPSGEEPAAPKGMPGFGTAVVANDAAGVETILVRLNPLQAARLNELWAQIDEQALKPVLRIAMDKNGMRAGKISGNTPPLLDEWVRQTVQRIGEDPMEQAGFAADVSSFSQLWRCRADVRKELSIRNFQEENLCVFYHDVASKGHVYEAPHFQYAIQATPHGDASATITLTPEMQHGELIKKMIARESAVRTDTRRESVAWKQLSIELRIQRGDYIVIGPTADSRGLGEHFFHTKTQKGEIQPVLLLVRLSEANSDSAFARPSTVQSPSTSFLR